MEWNEIEDQWPRVSSKVRERYSAVSDDELKFMDRNRDALVAKVRQRTGLELHAVENQLDALVASLPVQEPVASGRPPPPQAAPPK